MKPRIAILTHNMARGGAERFVSHLLAGLTDYFDIHLLLFDETIEYDLPPGQIMAYVERGFKGRQNLISIARLPLAARQIKQYCEANNIELLVSFLNRPNFAAGMAKLLGLKIPLIISERTYTPLWFNDKDLRGKIAKRLTSWLYPQANIILPNSEGTRKALREYYGIKTRCEVIRNIVDRDDIEGKMLEPVDDVTFDRFTFVHVGSFSPMKGHQMMVEAFSRLKRKDVQLLFIGKGVKLDEIRALVSSMGMEKNVLFLGHQENPFKYLCRSDCFILASEFEGFPNVLTEAMACGLPVISTDCETGPRELLDPGTISALSDKQTIEFGQFGILVPVGNVSALADAMGVMQTDVQKRGLYVRRGLERVADFDSLVAIDHFRSILNEYLRSPDNLK